MCPMSVPISVELGPDLVDCAPKLTNPGAGLRSGTKSHQRSVACPDLEAHTKGLNRGSRLAMPAIKSPMSGWWLLKDMRSMSR